MILKKLEVSLQFNANKTVSYVILKVYNREARTLVNGMKNPGRYEVKFDAGDLMSGIYFYPLQAGRFTETRKLMVLK